MTCLFIDSPLADDSWSLSETGETRFYYLQDALGSVTGLVGGRFQRESDREFYLYDACGAAGDVPEVGDRQNAPAAFSGYMGICDAQR